MKISALERFLRKVQPVNSGCWLWTGTLNYEGYGVIRVNGLLLFAHRYAYEQWVGCIRDDYVVDHLCRVPACVNPDHLEVVTRSENVRRGQRCCLRCIEVHKMH